MTIVTRNEKIYFAAVGLLALWVGIWGYFFPEHIDKAIPWLVPPLHARFLGATYISGFIIMSSSMMARRYAEVQIAVVITSLWTGMLFVISLFYLNEFDFSRGPVWFWFGAYITYPLIGFWLTWIHRTQDQSINPSLPNWIRSYLLIQGIITTLLALALLLAPEFMLTVWPWKITRLLIQIYSGPFIAYGLGALLLSRQQNWLKIRIVVTGYLTFTSSVILASFIHHTLFSFSSPAAWVWFGGFAIATVLLMAVIIHGKTYAGDSN